MSSNAGALIRHFPAMVKIGAATMADAFTRLYRRAYWRKRGVHIEPTARLLYASDKMMEIGYGCHVGLFTALVANNTPACQETPLLKVGERTWIGDHVNIRATGSSRTSMCATNR
jgi:hypothetical protein